MAPIPRLRDYKGPAILSYGFRPFFLFGSIYAGLAIVVWLALFLGGIEIPTAFSPRDWHVHEMLYGFLPAVVTGFLLTAVPNWTGRLPLQGRPLLVLVLVWAAGRCAVTFSAWLGWQLAAAIDVSFLLLVAAAIGREILAGRNWQNLKVLVVLSVLATGNLAFHLEANLGGAADYGIRIGIAALVALIVLIGGRIVPSFTRNWLKRRNPGRMPAPFGRYDIASMIVAIAALLAWCAWPEARLTGAALTMAGLAQAARLARWAGERAWHDPLVIILHLAYAFIPLGFFLVGGASFGWIPTSAGIHAWTGGAFGTMTLAVMSRATLGHTGRALVASPATQLVYGLVLLAAGARVWAALQPQHAITLLALAGFAWAAAFLGFAFAYWHAFTRPRLA